jgi:hypothetical protein
MSSLSSLLSAPVRVPARFLQLAVLILSLTAAAAPAHAQGDVDLKMVSAYTLTMPKYKQYVDATVNLANVAAKDPGLAKRLDGFGNQPLAEQVKLLEGTPQLRGAITAAGLTPRDFLLTQGAMLQAGMANALIKQASRPPDSAIKESGVSRANLEFFQQNEAELGRLAEEAQARAPKLPDVKQ